MICKADVLVSKARRRALTAPRAAAPSLGVSGPRKRLLNRRRTRLTWVPRVAPEHDLSDADAITVGDVVYAELVAPPALACC